MKPLKTGNKNVMTKFFLKRRKDIYKPNSNSGQHSRIFIF